jgi:hypothetical protein
MKRHGTSIEIQERSLLWVNGASVIKADNQKTLRYIYEDGTSDAKSTIDERTPHLEVDNEQLLTILDQKQTKKAGQIAILGTTETEPIMLGLAKPYES